MSHQPVGVAVSLELMRSVTVVHVMPWSAVATMYLMQRLACVSICSVEKVSMQARYLTETAMSGRVQGMG